MSGVDLLALAAQCEQASGSDREIDEAIFRALGWTPVPNPTCAGGLYGRWTRNSVMTGQNGLPCYTALLDDALTLVPDGAFWSITMRGENQGGFHACCQLQGPLEWIDGATPALALCASALRARHQSAAGEGE